MEREILIAKTDAKALERFFNSDLSRAVADGWNAYEHDHLEDLVNDALAIASRLQGPLGYAHHVLEAELLEIAREMNVRLSGMPTRRVDISTYIFGFGDLVLAYHDAYSFGLRNVLEVEMVRLLQRLSAALPSLIADTE